MTRRSEFRANCAQERQLTRQEFERRYTRSREERNTALAPWVAIAVSLVALVTFIIIARS